MLEFMLRPDYSQDIETYAWGLVLSGQTLSCVECMKFSNAREILVHVYYAGWKQCYGPVCPFMKT